LAYATISELSFGAMTRLASTLPATFTVERIGSKNEESSNRLQEELAEAHGRLKEGIKLAGEAEQRRNQLVHSHWFISPGYVSSPGTMTRMKTKTKSGSTTIAYESESINDVDANTERAGKAQVLLSSALHDYHQIAQFSW
jgi:uncharacterized glyoxalase superfamily protein PhnB